MPGATTVPTRPPRRRQLIDYPRSDRSGAARFVPRLRQVLGLVGLAILAVVALSGIAYATVSVPSPNQFASAQTTIVYYADGKTELGRFAAQNRVVVAADAIPESMKQATVAAEDRTFYENRGVSPKGIARAFWSNLQGDSTQGGSTITQQYVKNYYLSSDRTYVRKAKEAVLSLKIDQQQSKDEILTNYLNTIYFGRGAYGIETAAQAYFGKPAKDLTPQESALLAGIIPNPTNWDPAVNPAKAKARFDYVTDELVRTGVITQAERRSWTMPDAPKKDTNKNVYAGPNGYILAQVRSELLAAKLTDQDIDSGGLRIVTTVDKNSQDAAVAMMNDPSVYPTKGRPATLRAALVSIDPQSGAVVAMYGGDDYLKRQQNNATQAIAQAGSTFKPFALVTGLENGVGLRSTFNGQSGIRFKGTSKPIQNFGGASYGTINLLTATANSVNTVYVGLNQKVGPAKTEETAIRAGLPKNTAGLNDYLGNVLGSAAPHPIDMANAYATFAAQGVRHTPHIVASATKVGADSPVYTGPTDGTRVFPEDVMADTTYALRGVVQRGSGQPASALGRPAAGKTGTSSDNMSAWFVGYTPQLTTAVALFNTDTAGNAIPIPGFGGRSEITGGSFPVRMWTEYMRDALKGKPQASFPSPAWVGRATGPAASKPTGTSTRTRAPATRTRPATPRPSDTPTEPLPTQTQTAPATPAPAIPSVGSTQSDPNGNANGNGNGNADGTGNAPPNRVIPPNGNANEGAAVGAGTGGNG